MPQKKNIIQRSPEDRDDKSSFTSDHEDEGFTPLEFANIKRMQSIRCDHFTPYLCSVKKVISLTGLEGL
jgi:hypothetical protein